jgi:cobalamin biosynthesis Mg chelatase CobN
MDARRDQLESKQKNNGSMEQEHVQDEPLKGTFASVLILGAFIVVSWIGVLWLFIQRS